MGSFGGGGRVEYRYFLEGEAWREYALEAARQAIVNLDAIDAPAGEMVVVLGPGWPGILLHEAIGHGLEGDSIARVRRRSPGESDSASPARCAP